MSETQTTVSVDPQQVQGAIDKLAKHQLRERIKRVDGDEAHRILPQIWPVIQELCVIADACEAGIIEVKR